MENIYNPTVTLPLKPKDLLQIPLTREDKDGKGTVNGPKLTINHIPTVSRNKTDKAFVYIHPGLISQLLALPITGNHVRHMSWIKVQRNYISTHPVHNKTERRPKTAIFLLTSSILQQFRLTMTNINVIRHSLNREAIAAP